MEKEEGVLFGKEQRAGYWWSQAHYCRHCSLHRLGIKAVKRLLLSQMWSFSFLFFNS